MKKAFSKILSAILTAVILTSVIACGVVSGSAVYQYGYGSGAPYELNHPTQREIIAKAKQLHIDLSAPDTYREEYNLDPSSYAPGALSEETLQSCLDMLNLYRYVAGLPADIQIDTNYNKDAQAASLVNAANGTLTHYPEQPEGIDDDLYARARRGAGSGNIAMGYDNTVEAIAQAWMDDSDSNNLPMCGHRRWILSPTMQYVGFGSVENYQTMFAHDTSRSGYFAGDYIAWPAENTPIEMFSGSAFSVSLGADYDKPSAENVRVEISSETLGTSWTVDRDHPEQGFYIENSYYGIPKCIIFKVADFSKPDTLHVRITGITKSGVEAPIEYTVNLFTLSSVVVNHSYLVMRPMETALPDVTASCPINSSSFIYWTSSDRSIAGFYRLSDPNEGVIFTFKEGTSTLSGSYNGVTTDDVELIVSQKDVLLGDVDDDDDVSVLDGTVMLRQLAGIPVKTFREYAADTDRDNDFSALDVTVLMRKIAGLKGYDQVGQPMQNLN